MIASIGVAAKIALGAANPATGSTVAVRTLGSERDVAGRAFTVRVPNRMNARPNGPSHSFRKSRSPGGMRKGLFINNTTLVPSNAMALKMSATATGPLE